MACGVLTLGVLTRARARAERWGEWEPRGADRGGLGGVVGGGGLGGNTRWWRQVPKAEGEQN